MPLIQRVPWTVQPQTATGVNWGSPLARGLAVAFVPSIGPANLVASDVVAGLQKSGAGPDGVYTATSALVSTSSRLSTSAFSFYALFLSGTVSGGTRCVIGRGPNATGTNNIGFGFNSQHATSAYAGALYAGSAYTIIGKPTGGALALNTRYSIGGTFDGSNGRGYNNGVMTVGPTAVTGIDTTARLALNRTSADASPNADDAKFYVVLYWDRALSDAEMRAVHANPWQLFAPLPRTIWAPAAGGVSGTLATTNSNDTSAASGTTTVTGTLATTNANDTLAASGSVGSAVSGTLATTNANDTSAASGTTTVTGTVAYTNANDTAAASGWAGIVSGTLAVTNAADTLVASGSAAQSATAQNSGGELPWSKTPQAKKFREQEELRKQAQALIEQAQRPEADISALTFKAEAVSLLLQEDIARLERDAQAYQERLAKQAKKATQAKLMNAQNDARATRMLQAQVIDAQLRAQALVEELDVVFMAVMLAEMGD